MSEDDLKKVIESQSSRALQISKLKRKNYPSTLNARLVVRSNDELKEAFRELCASLGHKPSDAIRLMMLKSVREWELKI
ncbi:hypothetical protein [Vibrio nigripulchritudo]|uniref:hypothetical protein n=1 Tax=Vibrio nigripulchritudo TaxID=28173 RepID=UPI0003B20F78|nr:hypothetical protein [Vibrio nigripulchritudo]CCO40105.1 hypothetical protein VIBNISFn135_230002 [Vibrio nigripulchritudo SFn135]